ncbi:Kv channel-interacting protein 4-like isoform X3 [Toxorhynchites rutilus septentrionalis]|uniref:Kv channel-interacting protein 4-like isoform X3 n=1 Tax=Toxorhynchites rutilus septentrionalis TaxID=329112 RepID=UPI00247ABA2A|nr:Kv channel-interacting protein 4-like isoform X3 [Toxorhynchites rutilus septentrionalis]
MASLMQPSTARSQQAVHQHHIAIEIASEPTPHPSQAQQYQQQQQQIHHQELQAHALLAQCQQQQPLSLPSSNVDIVLRESTRANLISRKKTSIVAAKQAGKPSGKGEKNEGKSVYRKFFKRIKTILDGADPTTSSTEPEAEDLPVPQRYYPDSLGEITRTARFTEDEIKRIYRGFKAECPTGIVKEDTFKGIYSQFFPLASSGQYAHYVFNSIDLDRNGSLSFEEFVANLSILLRGTVDEKLQWTFSLYDINGDGCITKEEMKEIVTAIYELMGKVPEGCDEEQAIKEKVERLFEKMDRNCDGKITLDEFIECCTNDESIRRSIAVFDTIF